MLEKMVSRLTDAGIKPSLQRIKVLEYFHDHENHPTADQIFQDLKKEVPTLSKATVYNTLSLFVEKGLISPTMADRVHSRYDLTDKDHGHFVCTSCQEIYDFPYQPDTHRSLKGFKIESQELIIKGICERCLKDIKEE